MHFNILTLFPESLEPYLKSSIIGRAASEKLIHVKSWNIRDFATDKHKTVDDTPYGGGPGMVMKIEPIDRALEAIKKATGGARRGPRGKIVVLSARGTPFTQAKAAEYAKLDSLTLIAGRYEGIDQRVADHLADEEISIGPYVLAGGELPALVILEAVARLIPGVLGNPESLADSVSLPSEAPPTAERSWAQYTKPAVYKNWSVPEVLLSGNHEQIKKWRCG